MSSEEWAKDFKSYVNLLNMQRDDYNGVMEYIDDALALLKKQEGYWTVLTDCSNSGIYCSECQTKIFEYTTPPKKKLSQFCPHCGAKMAPWDQAVWL